MKSACFTAIILALFLSPASAKSHRHHNAISEKPYQKDWYSGPAAMPHYVSAPFDERHVVGSGYPDTLDIPPKGWPTQRQKRKPFSDAVHTIAHAVGEIVSHPAGCPRTAFCGCGAAAYLGLHDRSLWLAANWFKFPRAEPAPRMAAVRQHHVMIIVSYEGGNRALAYDANSGGHRTRIHEVSLSGYRIVNPHAG